jgi:hypothetical protein
VLIDVTADSRMPPPSPSLISKVHGLSSTPRPSDAEIEDAASILEFLAWGRMKNPNYSSVASPNEAGRRASDVGDIRPNVTLESMEGESLSQLGLLQLLLPNRRQLLQLVEYHHHSLLWYHGSYYAPTFTEQVEEFLDRFNGHIEHEGVNLQWVALLFSILTGSICCAPVKLAQEWGFREAEQDILSKRWFRAVNTCLTRAEYTANHSIFSVQAVATLTISAHLLGYSNMQTIHLASAVRIAQCLGLHKLGKDASGGLIEKETGRRVWSQLCTQDWFGIPFSETYLISPLYAQSELPLNCHDHDMKVLPESTPTITSYCRFLTSIAAIMPKLQDGMTASNTPYTKYEQVLTYDKQLRSLATAGRPIFLSNTSIEPDWPSFVPWARRALAISSSHKIIMIHRKFLGPSFNNPAFGFTRRTCIAAAKTIVKEYKAVVQEDGPVLWIHQAFSVAAAIILCLDILHREQSDREYSEQKHLVEDTNNILKGCRNSMIASRGVKLLSALLHEATQSTLEDTSTSRKRTASDGEDQSTPLSPSLTKRRKVFDVPAFVRSFCDGSISGAASLEQSNSQAEIAIPLSVPTTQQAANDDAEISAPHLSSSRQSDGFSETRPSQIDPGLWFTYPPPPLEGATSFENLLYLASNDLSILQGFK